MLPGLLMAAKGDRSTRVSATEGRYPFLDERWSSSAWPSAALQIASLDGQVFLRRVAARVLPPAIAKRSKTMFRPTWAAHSSAQINRAG